MFDKNAIFTVVKKFAPISLVILIALLFRLINVDRAFWHDELISVKTLDESILKNPFFYGVTTNLPFFFYLLKIWNAIVSFEVVNFRILPIMFNLINIIVVYYFIAKNFNTKFGMYAAILLAVSPLQIVYAQELRPYSLTQLLIFLIVIFLYKYFRNSKPLYLLIFTLISLISMLTHYVAHFFVVSLFPIALGLSFLVNVKEEKRLKYKYILGSFFLLFVFSFLIYKVMSFSGQFQESIDGLELSNSYMGLTGVRDSISLALTDITRIKEVLTFYYWYGLFYYAVDGSIQFVFKKTILVILFLVPFLLYKSKNKNLFVLISFLSLLFSLIVTVILERLGYYSFGGRQIMPYSILLYICVAYVLDKVTSKYKYAVFAVVLMIILFSFFNTCVGFIDIQRYHHDFYYSCLDNVLR